MERWKLEPATDLGLAPSERMKSLRRESGLIGTGVHLAWWLAVKLYLRLFHRLRILGREHLPPRPPFVMVANHSSHLDALVLSAALPARLCNRAFPIAAGDTFFTSATVSAFAALAMNALPLWRKRTRMEHLETLRARLAGQGCVFILFPEGTRARDGVMAAFKPGLGSLVAGGAVPVVPCYIDGAFQAFPPQAKLPRPAALTVRIGPPLDFAALANDKRAWAEIAAETEAAVRRLQSRS